MNLQAKPIIVTVIIFLVLFAIYNIAGYYTGHALPPIPSLPSCQVYCTTKSCVQDEMNISGRSICLDSDISTSITNLQVQADDITLNCRGHYIQGSGQNTVISSNGYNGFTLANCKVYNTSHGINVANGFDIRIYNNTFYDSRVYLTGSGVDAESGIKFTNVNNSYIESNIVYNIEAVKNALGIDVFAGENVTINYNTVHDIEGYGIVSSASNSIVEYNEVYDIDGDGIDIGGDDFLIEGNEIYDTFNGYGLYLVVTNSEIYSNEVYNNDDGTVLDSSEFNNMTDNTFFNNVGINLILYDSHENNIIDNNISYSEYGVYLEISDENVIFNNIISKTTPTCVWVTSTTITHITHWVWSTTPTTMLTIFTILSHNYSVTLSPIIDVE